MKQLIKQLLKYAPIALTKNQHYDRLTKKVIRKVCRRDSNCVDVGCHKGEILDLMRTAAPEGHHYGFEPIPDMYQDLVKKYSGTNCTISDIALSNKTGEATFNYVVTNPSYSGLLRRDYDRPNEEDTSITVQTRLLDDILPATYRADLIKIDVEGAEMLVLEGARETIMNGKPAIIFEHGLGASDIYGTTPEQLFRFFTGLEYKIALLEGWLKGKLPFTEAAFAEEYYSKRNFYFIAYSEGKN